MIEWIRKLFFRKDNNSLVYKIGRCGALILLPDKLVKTKEFKEALTEGAMMHQEQYSTQQPTKPPPSATSNKKGETQMTKLEEFERECIEEYKNEVEAANNMQNPKRSIVKETEEYKKWLSNLEKNVFYGKFEPEKNTQYVPLERTMIMRSSKLESCFLNHKNKGNLVDKTIAILNEWVESQIKDENFWENTSKELYEHVCDCPSFKISINEESAYWLEINNIEFTTCGPVLDPITMSKVVGFLTKVHYTLHVR